MYDYLIVGCGISGATFARLMTDKGKKCLIIEKRNHIAGNVYSEKIESVEVHKYGAHIFHTSNENVWEFINRFSEFNNFINSPIANYKGEIYNLPFNMNTFNKLWGVTTPFEARKYIENQVKKTGIVNPLNLEEQAISLVGIDVYKKLIKEYTEKQWGKSCKLLPPFIIKRLPVRFTFDNNYFNDIYQGIPVNGYKALIENMTKDIEIRLNTDFSDNKKEFESIAKKVFYTGMIDEYYDYCFGELSYRSLKFENEILNTENHQGVAVVNYTDRETPFTRIIEHKHFMFSLPQNDKTVITKEFPCPFEETSEPYYPINDEENSLIYEKYREKSLLDEKVLFGGRLGQYQYFDMDKVIFNTFELVKNEF